MSRDGGKREQGVQSPGAPYFRVPVGHVEHDASSTNGTPSWDSNVRRIERSARDATNSRFARRFTLEFLDEEKPDAVELTLGDFDLVQLSGASQMKITPAKSVDRCVLFYGSRDLVTTIHAQGDRLHVPVDSPAQVMAEARVTASQPGNFLLVAVPQRFLEEHGGAIPGDDAPARLLMESTSLLAPIADFMGALFEMGPTWRPMVAYFAERMIHEMGLTLLIQSSVEPPAAPARPSLYRRAEQIIAGSASDPRLTPNSLAQLLGCSLRTLQRAFAERGMSVAQQIRSARTQIALDYLEQPEWRKASMTQLAKASGFPSLKALRSALADLNTTTNGGSQ